MAGTPALASRAPPGSWARVTFTSPRPHRRRAIICAVVREPVAARSWRIVALTVASGRRRSAAISPVWRRRTAGRRRPAPRTIASPGGQRGWSSGAAGGERGAGVRQGRTAGGAAVGHGGGLSFGALSGRGAPRSSVLVLSLDIAAPPARLDLCRAITAGPCPDSNIRSIHDSKYSTFRRGCQ